MKSIQIDMYAVGLGSAILTQFRHPDGRVVRVLADGGMGPGGYEADGVLQRLPEALAAFGNAESKPRIDLIVGTHYDGDHLKGLIPIAADEAIEIGEVWLPPVKDDSDEVPGHVSEARGFLADRFFAADGEKVLRRYLDDKRREIEELSVAENAALGALDAVPGRLQGRRELPFYRRNIDRPTEAIASRALESIEDYLAYFKGQESDAARVTGTESTHAAAEYASDVPDLRRMARVASRNRHRSALLNSGDMTLFGRTDPTRLRLVPGALASIRKSRAADAITAIHLQKLVDALRKRNEPIRPVCQYITAGRPVRHVWNASKSRFIARAQGGDTNLTLTLLGPSSVLIKRHRDKMPVGAYLLALRSAVEVIPRESITESNQLSYVLVLAAENQRILISGDAGCYDFRDENLEYFPRLLEALQPLHVIQVAHHGGRNYDFYNTLLEAKFAEQQEASFLLLSHAVRDATRPSESFRKFIAAVRRAGDDIALLFTSVPDRQKVADYDELVAPVVPSGASADKGDVRLVYTSARGAWVVEKHAVAIQP